MALQVRPTRSSSGGALFGESFGRAISASTRLVDNIEGWGHGTRRRHAGWLAAAVIVVSSALFMEMMCKYSELWPIKCPVVKVSNENGTDFSCFAKGVMLPRQFGEEQVNCVMPLVGHHCHSGECEFMTCAKRDQTIAPDCTCRISKDNPFLLEVDNWRSWQSVATLTLASIVIAGAGLSSTFASRAGMPVAQIRRATAFVALAIYLIAQNQRVIQATPFTTQALSDDDDAGPTSRAEYAVRPVAGVFSGIAAVACVLYSFLIVGSNKPESVTALKVFSAIVLSSSVARLYGSSVMLNSYNKLEWGNSTSGTEHIDHNLTSGGIANVAFATFGLVLGIVGLVALATGRTRHPAGLLWAGLSCTEGFAYALPFFFVATTAFYTAHYEYYYVPPTLVGMSIVKGLSGLFFGAAALRVAVSSVQSVDLWAPRSPHAFGGGVDPADLHVPEARFCSGCGIQIFKAGAFCKECADIDTAKPISVVSIGDPRDVSERNRPNSIN